ncbi:multidrug effflux MFS transporter [Zavarzinia compransoris]|uniref:Bcr/CflA family efflux transporter n=1 Tax=Zavarzinia compransoris TaxID=1264899 RepID=A0A317E0N5_9PROT|nr:multidrug effflux MFS transporter [Zavarzinia compransoris]PWR20004.1 Bcr/CflA family drug resistance efflux transporter [Zavarzinia compransoris]TDP44877.1 DHA1 family bicyclomycin/chloramphenicol resistance-like MFS transporter [Zavarzinia compransoris]
MSDDPHRGSGARPDPRAPLWLLALLTFSGTLAMHIFVPALPRAGADLAASPAEMQLTISLYILGLAFGQLIYGPVADRFGRRPVLMAGLILYTLAGLASVVASGAEALIAARLFQALGGCAGLVLGRAIVRDLSAGSDAARRMALMNLMVVIGPGVAPLAGTLLAETLGWRSILWALVGLGGLNLLLTWRLLAEPARPASGGAAAVLRNYAGLLRSPAFLGYALGGACATTSMYGYVAAAPFIYTHELGRPDYEVGIYLAVLILGIWLGSVLASWLAPRIETGRMLALGNGTSAAAGIATLAVVLGGLVTVPLLVGLMFVFTFGMGLASPAAMTKAISVDPRAVASASGLYGFVQMAVGALCAALAGVGDSPMLAAAVVLAGAGVIGQASFRLAARSERAKA